MRTRSASLLLLLSVLTPAAASAAEPSPPPRIDLATAPVVDLTWAFDDKTIYWPTSPSAFELKSLAKGVVPGGWFYSSNSFCTPEHGGTHMDAPIHFSATGRTADQVPPRQLIAPAAVLDVSAKAAADPDYRLTADDVRAFERRHGAIAAGTIVLLRTGWGKRWPDRKAYLGDDTPGDASHLHFPSYGPDAAKLLVGNGTWAPWVSTPRRSIPAPRRIFPSIGSPTAPTFRASRTWRTSRRCPRSAPSSSRCR